MQGLIIKATGSWYTVKLDNRKAVPCRLPGKFRLSEEHITNPVAVGDNVSVALQSDGTGVIERIFERKNRLVRQATHRKKGIQIIAANLDQILVIQSYKQPVFKTGFIDRLVVSSEANDIQPVIVLNKIDLAKKEKDKKKIFHLVDLYTSLGYTVLPLSIYDKKSMDNLYESISGKTSAMTGHSGTGKTSIINTLNPELNFKTGEISSFSNKGKHTTTFAQLITFSEQTFVVDTPGIREFGLVNFKPYEVSLFYPEMKDLRDSCHFYNCTHRHEPSCAIIDAYRNGTIAESRYRSYVNIVNSIEDSSEPA